MDERDDDIEAGYALGRVPGRFYVSRRFKERVDVPDQAPRVCRFGYRVFDPDSEVEFHRDGGWEVVVRETPTRQQLKALFFEDTRLVKHLLFQRFTRDGVPIARERFILSGDEVYGLSEFLSLIQSPDLELAEDEYGVKVLPAGIEALLSNEASRLEIFRRYREIFAELVADDVESPEVIAFARRRRQLKMFDRLLTDPTAFAERQAELASEGRAAGPEAVWQDFFEANRWIFGSGLAPQFLHAWDERRLEQATVGSSAFAAGKRPDALLRTAGALSAIVFVEIKRHDTHLTHDAVYRPGVWRVSDELAGGVSQCQTTVDETVRATERQVQPLAPDGKPRGVPAMVCRPRSILVVGRLNEFTRDGQLNRARYENFERFRRSIDDPEIVTYDELYERARLVLALAEPDDET